ncbi:MAG: PucR family transcriptional regulator ligand-binding domain-containing protein [Chloroflexota bacterium]|nr:PucR family transcriptional regulator ligand-binding domain-containing protein [Chloroflexota bacterium]
MFANNDGSEARLYDLREDPNMEKDISLELPVLRAVEALDGSVLAGDRWLVGVSVIEVPVEIFVRRGELILSTAMAVGRDEALLSAFVGEVAAPGAAALVLNLGPYLPGLREMVGYRPRHVLTSRSISGAGAAASPGWKSVTLASSVSTRWQRATETRW